MSKQRTKNSNDNADPSFNLDAYLSKKSEQNTPSDKTEYSSIPHRIKKSTYWLKNTLLGVGIVLITFLWYHDWNANQALKSIFGFEQTALPANETVQELLKNNGIEVFENTAERARVLEELLQNELSNQPELQTMPSGIDYLAELKEKGLISNNKLSVVDATQLYESNTPISLIEQINQEGYLGELDPVAIYEIYKNNVPLSYITLLHDNNYLRNTRHIAIPQFFKAGVTIEYLDQLRDAGYYNNLDWFAVPEFFKAGVTIEFLNELVEKNLYKDLRWFDVVELYKSESD